MLDGSRWLATYDIGIELSNLGVLLIRASIACEVTHAGVVLCQKVALRAVNAVLIGFSDDNIHCHVPWKG